MRFLLRIILFLLPIALVMAFPLWLGWYTGEFASLKSVIESQKRDKSLFGLQYNAVDLPYKQALIAAGEPEVLVLGTSRTLEFEANFFNSPDTFLNGGKAVEHVEDYAEALALASSSVKLIIVAVDADTLKPIPPARNALATTSLDRLKAFFVQKQWLTAYRQFFPTKESFRALLEQRENTHAIGINALEFADGYMPDGSYLFGRVIKRPDRLAILDEAGRSEAALIESTPQEFEYAPEPDPSKLNTLEEFLRMAKSRGIHVVGFSPTFSYPVYAAIAARNDEYGDTMRTLPTILEALFARYGYPYFDYTAPGTAHVAPTEFVDMRHVSDKGQARELLDMAARDPLLREYVNVLQLRKDIEVSGDFIVRP